MSIENLTSFPIKDKIKTIVFDLGGVVFTSGTHLTLVKLVEKYHIEDWKSLNFFFKSEHNSEGALLRLGHLSIDEFETKFYLKFKINENHPQNLRMIWFSNYIPYFSMLKILKELCEQYRLIVFSGNIEERIRFLDSRYKFLKFFHKSLFSYEYHYAKTDREFYYELLKHLYCKPSEALLIDDSFEVVEIAKSFGIHSILFSYTEQFTKELLLYGIKTEI
ncbi:MAG: HAD family hydrolase [Promethearchaeota archaeon]